MSYGKYHQLTNGFAKSVLWATGQDSAVDGFAGK
jgi:hypothetical protein